MSLADLHIHSNNSDGSDSIKNLAKIIEDSGIKIFALTDHDTVSGCEEMEKIISSKIKFIPSIELTCRGENIKCHILGYNCDYKNENLLKLIEKGKVLRRQKLETRINYLKEVWNIVLTQEELDWLYSRKSVVKTHIANILVKRKLANDNVSAMKKYLDGCKSGDTRFSIEESIKTILDAGGIPVWAHPLGGEGEKHDSAEIFLPKLKKMINYGIQGLECYYSRYSQEEANFLARFAQENNLLISGGSDYHGSNKDIPIGKLSSDGKKINLENLTVLKKLIY